MMKIEKSLTLTSHQRSEVQRLWNEEFPDTLRKETMEDLMQYFSKLGRHRHFLLTDADQMVGWMITFDRAGDRWLALLVDRKWPGRGPGSRLIAYAKQHEKVLNGWVVDESNYYKADGSAYPSPLEFYLKNDFRLVDDRFENEKMRAVRVRWVEES